MSTTTFKSVEQFLKFNDSHDESGRFASGDGGGSAPERTGGNPSHRAGLQANGWRGKSTKGGKVVYRHPDYPEEKITVSSSGRWTHSDDDGEIASGSGGKELGDHLGHNKPASKPNPHETGGESDSSASETRSGRQHPAYAGKSAEYIATLPDTSFAYVAPGGVQKNGITEPQSLRYAPYKDELGQVDPQALCDALNGVQKFVLPKATLKRVETTLKAAAADVMKYITHENGKWQVHAESGKLLGEHDSKGEAQAQLAAVESNKKSAEPAAATVKALFDAFQRYAATKGLVFKAEQVEAEEVETSTFGTVYKIAAGDDSAYFVEKDSIAVHVPHYMRLQGDGFVMVYKKEGDAEKPEYQKYTLGVVYPAKQIDFHGDTMSHDELEKAAWNFMGKDSVSSRVGLMHKQGTAGAARVVESYIYRGPKWEMKDATGADQTVMPGDWLMGVVWNDEGWNAIKAGEITGYSLQGIARKEEGN